MKSSYASFHGELGEQTIMNKDENLERVTEWVDSSVAHLILSRTLCSNRATNEFFPASNSLRRKKLLTFEKDIRCTKIQ